MVQPIIAAVLCYNQPDLTRAMVDQLPGVFVIDNGSTVRQPFTDLRLESNGYFSGGWNAAMRELTDYDWVWMLNSDVERVSPQMLFELVAQAGDYSMISPSFNSPHAHMQPQGKGVRPVSWIDWTAPIMRMSTWLDVGEFDAEHFPGYGADIDWCYRARQKGYRFAVSDQHNIHHLGSQTALSEGLQSIQGNVGAMNEAFHSLYGVSDWTHFIYRFLSD